MVIIIFLAFRINELFQLYESLMHQYPADLTWFKYKPAIFKKPFAVSGWRQYVWLRLLKSKKNNWNTNSLKLFIMKNQKNSGQNGSNNQRKATVKINSFYVSFASIFLNRVTICLNTIVVIFVINGCLLKNAGTIKSQDKQTSLMHHTMHFQYESGNDIKC